MGRLRRVLPSPRTTRGKLAIGAFVTTFLLLTGTTASFAAWSSTATVSSTLGAATLTLDASNFTNAAYTFGNDALTTTTSVTVKNSTVTTSTQSEAVSLTFGPAAAATLAGLVTLNLWSTTAASNCTAAATVPTGATTALWSATSSVSTTLAPGASAIYCLRSSIASRETVAVTGGAMSFSPKITGTITLGNFTGSTSLTVTQATAYIYPAYTVPTTSTTVPTTSTWNWIRPNPSYTSDGKNVCMDVANWNYNPGSQIISYSCNLPGTANQLWQITPSTVSGYYWINPKSVAGPRLDNQSTSTADSIVINPASNTSAGQRWQLQGVSTGVYEIVNAYSGECLTAQNSPGDMLQQSCNGGAAQQFFISPAFTGFACSVAGSNVTWSWTGPLSSSTVTYAMKVTTSGGTTTTVKTAVNSSATLSMTGYSGTYTVTFVDSYGTTVASGTFTTGSPNTCTATALVP